ncbi:hypothetical protein HPB50_006179 [Hyalomma asiaticum]|uniref:Uncharacterized protein n=1 Tax=Hyalomma asiaticum TaxID=266040 RepID=A0ACB7SNY0_HYAAI|nr:hypothetical protein HPB50_006179 [Hyalomma asiaticum]
MADTTEDFPPGFTLSSTVGRSRAYDLLLREAVKILNCPASRVPLSPRRRTHRTKRHTPARQAKSPRPRNTSSQPAVPFLSTTGSQGPFSLPASPLQPAREAAAAAILKQEEQHSYDASSSSWEHSAPPLTAASSPHATTENNSQPSVAPAGPSAPAPSSPSHTTPTGKEARCTRCVLVSVPSPADEGQFPPLPSTGAPSGTPLCAPLVPHPAEKRRRTRPSQPAPAGPGSPPSSPAAQTDTVLFRPAARKASFRPVSQEAISALLAEMDGVRRVRVKYRRNVVAADVQVGAPLTSLLAISDICGVAVRARKASTPAVARALQTCGKLFQRATPRAFAWFAARPESSEETRASLSSRFPPWEAEPSDEGCVAPSGQ